MLQFFLADVWPRQDKPHGLVQIRTRFLVPPPHDLEQPLQLEYFPHCEAKIITEIPFFLIICKMLQIV